MDARQDRVARNEAMYRAVNRELQRASEEAGAGPEDPLEVICECGREGCSTTLALTSTEYDEAHAQRDRFVVTSGHENPQIEHVVARKEHYLIVDKFGEAERAAEAEERRQGTD
jgi:diaminopimelate decarboxylase